MTWAGTRSAVVLRRCMMPAACSVARRSARALRAARVAVLPRDEVQEVLPRALRASLAERGELLAQDVVLGHRLDERDELVLALARRCR